jgi:hypothetical protein
MQMGLNVKSTLREQIIDIVFVDNVFHIYTEKGKCN